MGEGSDAVEVGMKTALEASKNVELVKKLVSEERDRLKIQHLNQC